MLGPHRKKICLLTSFFHFMTCSYANVLFISNVTFQLKILKNSATVLAEIFRKHF